MTNQSEHDFKTYIFDNFEDAFYFCKKENHPIIVKIEGNRWRLYPGGTAEPLSDKPEIRINLIIGNEDFMDWTQYELDPETGKLVPFDQEMDTEQDP